MRLWERMGSDDSDPKGQIDDRTPPSTAVLLHVAEANFEPRDHSSVSVVCSDGSAQPKLVVCGLWDATCRVQSLDASLKELGCVWGSGQFTCVHATPYQGTNHVVTGGTDGLCRIWSCEPASSQSIPRNVRAPGTETDVESAMTCLHVLYGHVEPICSVYYSSELDMTVSASMTGLICLHAARSGRFVRSIRDLVDGFHVEALLLCASGTLVVHCSRCPDGDDAHAAEGVRKKSTSTITMPREYYLKKFWINGQLLKSLSLSQKYVHYYYHQHQHF